MNLPINYINNILSRKQAFVEVCLSENSVSYNLLIASRKKQQLINVKKLFDIKTIDELITTVPNKIPVHLTFTGYGVISKIKVLPGNDQIENEEYMLQTFPNLNHEEIYYTIFISGNQGIISILRKFKLQDILKNLSDKLQVTDVIIGISGIAKIGEYIQEIDYTIFHRGLGYHFKDAELVEILQATEKKEDAFRIGDELIEEDMIIPYGAALNYFNKSTVWYHDLELETNNRERTEQLFYEKIYNILWKGSLVALLFILLANYFVFAYLSEKNSRLQDQISFFEKTDKNLQQNLLKTDNLNRILGLYGFRNQFLYSIYMDELVNELTNKITLLSVEFHPQIKANEKEKIRFEQNKVLIKGNTLNMDQLNKFVIEMSAKQWVDHLDIVKIEEGKDENQLNFILELFIRIG